VTEEQPKEERRFRTTAATTNAVCIGAPNDMRRDRYSQFMGVALVTGLVFAKASRPQSSLLFSDVSVIAPRDGVPHLEFRLANARGNDVIEATVRVTILIDEISSEGHQRRRLHDLVLARAHSPSFALTWTVMHKIDENSPLFGRTLEDLVQDDSMIIVTMTGWDLTSANNVHARQRSYAENLRYGQRFFDVMERLDDGRLQIDMRRFHETEALEPSETEPETVA
jgi:inward rectifier potassium channel